MCSRYEDQLVLKKVSSLRPDVDLQAQDAQFILLLLWPDLFAQLVLLHAVLIQQLH